jgi:hypothetical protein
MLEMFSDLVPGGNVRFMIGVDLDNPSVGQLLKVMLRIRVRKSQGVVPTHVHPCRVLVRGFLARWALRGVLCVDCQGGEHDAYQRSYLQGDYLLRLSN